MTTLLHASAVSIAGQAVLLRGPSGAGKSELALQLIEQHGAELLADDQCKLERRDDDVIVSAPENLRGLLELRGFGILRLPSGNTAPLALVVDLLSQNTTDRLPEDADLEADILGITFPRLTVKTGSPSAPSRVCAALKYPRISNEAVLAHDKPAS